MTTFYWWQNSGTVSIQLGIIYYEWTSIITVNNNNNNRCSIVVYTL